MYKLIYDDIGGGYCIRRNIDLAIIPMAFDNTDYQQFVDDIYANGIEIVEGADYVGVTTYTDARAAEYPSLEEQQDMQYWDAVNGTTTWKDKIAEIKAKYPKSQVGVVTTSVPNWIVGLST